MPITRNGYVKRTPEEIRQAIVDGVSGTSFALQSADVQSNIIDVSVPVLMQFESIMADALNSYNITGGSDYIFLQQAESLNLVKRKASKGNVSLEFTGTPNLFIPAGTIVSTEDGKFVFTTRESVVLNSIGKGTVLGYTDTDGTCDPNTVTKILTSIDSSLTVTNRASSIRKLEEETIEELKLRAQKRLRSPATGGIEYATSLLAGLDGVDSRLISFRQAYFPVDYTNEDGPQIYGIEAVIGGGDDSDIANALFQCFVQTNALKIGKSARTDNRGVSVNLKYYGSLRHIEFTRPKELKLNIKLVITLKRVTTNEGTVRNLVYQKFNDYINSKSVGEPFCKNEIQFIVTEILKEVGVPLEYIQVIDTEIEGQEFGTDGYLTSIDYDVYLTLGTIEVELKTLLN